MESSTQSSAETSAESSPSPGESSNESPGSSTIDDTVAESEDAEVEDTKVIEHIVDEAKAFIEEHPDMVVSDSKLPSYLRDVVIRLGKYHVKHEDELHKGNAPNSIYVDDVELSILDAIKEAIDFIEEHRHMIITPGMIPAYFRSGILKLGWYHIEHENELEHNEPPRNHSEAAYNSLKPTASILPALPAKPVENRPFGAISSVKSEIGTINNRILPNIPLYQ